MDPPPFLDDDISMNTTRPATAALDAALVRLPAPARMPREWSGSEIVWPSEESIAAALWYRPVTSDTATVAMADKAAQVLGE